MVNYFNKLRNRRINEDAEGIVDNLSVILLFEE